jgi:phosphoserine aminotransferase
MNFATETGSLNYLITGAWSKKASAYASSIANVNVVSDSSSNNFTDIADSSTWNVKDGADYFFYCANETVHGLEIHEPIESESPLICDMSSTIASRPIDINKYDLIFAGAQKNLGIAGVTILIIKKNLLSRVNKGLLPILDYSRHADDASMLNTSPVFAWYVSGLIFDWIRDQGGVEKMAELNQEKSGLLYNFIDQSSFYSNPVSRSYRSWMNIPFILSRNDLDDEFIKSAEDSGLLNLKGHRTVGGMRASVYNAMPIEGVKKLIAFMDEFAKLHE